jgi:hypothetical protein
MRPSRRPSFTLQTFRFESARRSLAATFAVLTATAAAASAGGLQPEDQRPVITVTSPAEGTVAQPDVRVTAHCTDDQPGCKIQVSVGAKRLAWADGGSIDTVVRPPDGAIQLSVTTIDSAGHHVSETRGLFVNSSPKLTLAVTLPAEIIDIDDDRALVVDRNTPMTLRIVDRATNASQIIWTHGSVWQWHGLSRAYLSPGGAVFTLNAGGGRGGAARMARRRPGRARLHRLRYAAGERQLGALGHSHLSAARSDFDAA